MTPELTTSRVTIGTVTFNPEAGPAPRSSQEPFLFDLMGSLLLVLFFVGVFLAFKVCLETCLPYFTHGIEEQARAVRGY